MSALEAKEKPVYNATRREGRPVVIKQSKHLQERTLEKPGKKPINTLADQRLGLPPQPTEYIKYPTHDWF
jgi:hypothetical protein